MTVEMKVLEKDGSDSGSCNLTSEKSMLDIALDNNINILFGCFGGSCGTCKCSIEEGEELIDKEATRSAIYGDLKEKEFLPCIAKLKEGIDSGKIVIKKTL